MEEIKLPPAAEEEEGEAQAEEKGVDPSPGDGSQPHNLDPPSLFASRAIGRSLGKNGHRVAPPDKRGGEQVELPFGTAEIGPETRADEKKFQLLSIAGGRRAI
jgi:hypothetical protein